MHTNGMALVRILVDGYSLLHCWQDLAPGKPRHSAAARDELIHWLRRYRDAVVTPVTLFFDGSGAPAGTPAADSSPEFEGLYSKRGKTADDLIERATFRLLEFGEVLVVTNDHAERDVVLSLGASTSSCELFIMEIERALEEEKQDITRYNRAEKNRYRKSAS